MTNSIDAIIFCKNIKTLREHHHLSKAAMAKKLHIGIRTLNALESGVIPPRLSADIALYIHKDFGITPSRIFGEFIE